jgi:hypothetical protein
VRSVKVRLLVGLSGPTFNLQPGDIYECDEAEATRLHSARYAIPYEEDRIERAVVAPAPERRDPLDHDGDGKPGGSLKGAQSTRAKGARKKEVR